MVFEKVREIICDQLELDEDVVTMDAILLEDLGADSIDLADLVMTFEDEFDMEISDEALENIKTVSDIVKFIEEH
ncbi:MAG: acyl carrier protein [Clostridia bacterium]|nr:acyl carrier protein [Oscillospiraceae bacterium]MBO5943714.1 acyl carrier protein [Clostridia bacterium]